MVGEIPPPAEIADAEAKDPHLLSRSEQSALLAGHPWSRFVVLGDSIALGVGDPSKGYRTATWAERVAAALASERDGFSYVNLARRRARVSDLRDSQLRAALEFEPDLAVVFGGGDDCLVTGEFDVAPVEAALDEIVVELTGAGATVVTFEALDFPHAFPDPAFREFHQRLLDLYAAVREIAQRRRTVHVDLYREPWSGERYCFSADLQHLTMRAQALCASTTIRALGRRLSPRELGDQLRQPVRPILGRERPRVVDPGETGVG